MMGNTITVLPTGANQGDNEISGRAGSSLTNMLRMQTDSPLEQSLLPRPYNANAYDDASSSKDDFRF